MWNCGVFERNQNQSNDKDKFIPLLFSNLIDSLLLQFSLSKRELEGIK
jgi:hypothetical protein